MAEQVIDVFSIKPFEDECEHQEQQSKAEAWGEKANGVLPYSEKRDRSAVENLGVM